MAQITYADKVAINENPNVNAINKIRDEDMNEIKEVVNENATTLNNLVVTTQTTSDSNTYSCNYINNNIEGVTDISSLITKFSSVGTVYLKSAYRKGNRCYLDAQFEISAIGTVFTLDNSIKPSKDSFGTLTNYSTSNGITGFVKVTGNSTNVVANVYGSLLPYAVFHIEWEI